MFISYYKVKHRRSLLSNFCREKVPVRSTNCDFTVCIMVLTIEKLKMTSTLLDEVLEFMHRVGFQVEFNIVDGFHPYLPTGRQCRSNEASGRLENEWTPTGC